MASGPGRDPRGRAVTVGDFTAGVHQWEAGGAAGAVPAQPRGAALRPPCPVSARDPR